MVNKLAEIQPRSSGDTIVPNDDNDDGDFFRLEQLRDVFIFENGLDVYAEVTVESTHSRDPDFTNPLTNEEGIPILSGDTRESAFLDSNEIVRLTVTTPTAPSSGSFTVWRESDHTPLDLDSTDLSTFGELNQGRTYATDTQESLADTGTLTLGIRNPSDAETNVFVRQFGLAVGADALITTEIDHGSYTDGTAVPIINKKPELQAERPIEASITTNPTISSPQESMTAFLPGGETGTATGGRFAQPDYELSPGQDMAVTLENISGSTNRYGFSLEVIETVVR